MSSFIRELMYAGFVFCIIASVWAMAWSQQMDSRVMNFYPATDPRLRDAALSAGENPLPDQTATVSLDDSGH